MLAKAARKNIKNIHESKRCPILRTNTGYCKDVLETLDGSDTILSKAIRSRLPQHDVIALDPVVLSPRTGRNIDSLVVRL